MTYPREHESIVRAAYSSLIERGISPHLALLVSEVMGRDAAGIERTQQDQHYVSQVAAALNDMTLEEYQRRTGRAA